MRWCVRNKLDGVCTDDPKRFLRICADWHDEKEEGWSVKELFLFLRLQVVSIILAIVFIFKFGHRLEQRSVKPRA